MQKVKTQYDMTVQKNAQAQIEFEALAQKEKGLLVQREAQEKVLQMIEIDLQTETKKHNTAQKLVEEQLEQAKKAVQSVSPSMSKLNKMDEKYKEFSTI